MGGAMFSKSLIQFSVDGQGCVPSLLYRGNIDNPSKGLVHALLYSVPLSGGRPLLSHASSRESWTLTGKPGSVSCGITAPFSWVLVCTRVCLCLLRVCFPVLWKFYNQIPLASKVKFSGSAQSLCQIPRLGNLLWVLELS